MAQPGKVLIIDDTSTVRLKLRKAIEVLGHDPVAVSSGAEGIKEVQRGTYDVVLLDIIMPEMDGFQVLQILKSDRAMREVPVIIISAIDDEMSSVVRAIELGAEDFLPKDFSAVLLRARLNTCIEKKKYRDQELDYLKQVDALSDAAAIMELGKFNPKKLNIGAVSNRQDALGRLARVFGAMAEQVYQRELKLQRNIRSLKGGLMLLVCGLIWGFMVPLSRLISQDVPQATGVSFWINLIGGVLCCAWALYHRSFTNITWATAKFLVLWALLTGGSSILLFVVAGHIPGIIISVIIALQGFAVFLLASILRIEEPSVRRFAGLVLGLLAVAALLFTREKTEGVNDMIWLVLALGIPLLYGAADILVAARHPPDLDMTAGMGLVLLASAVLVLPLALATGEFFVPGLNYTSGHGLILAGGVLSALGNVAYVLLIAWTGAVFASQSAYAITIAGIGWSMVLLGESLTMFSLAALVLIIVGLALVGPKKEAGDIEIEFRSRYPVT